MASIKSYKDLIVWQESMILVKEVFALTARFPKSELYGIISQIRRSAISIPSNIAEAFGRRSVRSTAQFYSIALGSALELETQLLISRDLKMADLQYFKPSDDLLLEVCKMLNSMTGKLKFSTNI
ncbi:MAG: four helix bundle protein [Patescibacteria group bacterium]